MSRKIFDTKTRIGTDIVNLSWQSNLEKELEIDGVKIFGYISGYKDSADSLVENVKGTDLKDSHVFPIVFLYRQYLELVLKNLYVKIKGKNPKTKMDHDLSKLWEKIKKEIEQVVTKEQIKHIDSVIYEFQNNDPGSFYFRYFWNKNYSETLPDSLSIDLGLLKESIDEVDTILYFSYGMT